jgi:DNA-directed RNA polymerase specialized sigma24 family protein
MEQYWNKKRIGPLLRGDSGSLDLFYSQYKPVLFTWMYYQVGADAEIAADLTARTFDRAIEQINLFDPHGMTMLQWLREHAKAARDEGLLRWQLKPQRPWAWSQPPDRILNSLAVIRSEPLQNSVAENPFVQEIVQASLAELEQTDRELMMHRYSHLDTPTNIADEMDLSVEAVNDLLYKCRHSFRRVFFRLVSSVNPGFAESDSGAGIEVLDGNLEKLLRATGMYQSPTEAKEAMLRERFQQAAAQAARSQPPANTSAWPKIAVFAAIGLAVTGILVGVLRKDSPQVEMQAAAADAAPVPTHQPADVQAFSNTAKAVQADIGEEELKLILELGQAGQIGALREFLKSGLFTSQIAAAHFLGKLGQPSDIQLLEAAEDQWYANGPADNPFALAAHEIIQRYPNELAVSDISSAPVPADKTASEQKTVTLTGHARGFSGETASGAKIEITVNPLFSGQASAPATRAVTDDTGSYQVSRELEGACFVKCMSSLEGLESVREAIWIRKGNAGQCDFGGPSVITGKVGLNSGPLGGLKLILSDADEPAKAAFLAEAVAGGQGDFTFSGVRPGIYRLLTLNENKKLICLESSLEVRENDFFRIDLDLTPVSVMVEYPEPNAVVSASLAHLFESSYEEKAAVSMPDGNLQFHNVIAGSYLLRLELTTGIRLEQMVNIQPGLLNQVITAEPLMDAFVSLGGKLTGTVPAGLLLESLDRRIQIPVKSAGDGSLDLPEIPADFYHLTGLIRGTRIVFTSIDLTAPADSEIELDIDLAHIIKELGSIFAVVINSDGKILSGARISLADDEWTTVESTAHGAFLAAPAGKQTLYAELAGYAPREIQVDLPQPLTAEPSKDNIVLIELSR